jgi:hypothetical protein
MARYKGQYGALINERNFPHIVEVVVPPGGLGKTLDFHCRHGVQAKRGQGRNTNGRNFIRWCFADSAIAESFATAFAASI